MALAFEEAGEYDTALELLGGLTDYQGSATHLISCKYGKAQQLMEASDYEGALQLFTELGAYEDSETQLKKCCYNYGKQLFDEGDYPKAQSYLQRVGKYKDARNMGRRAIFLWMKAYYEENALATSYSDTKMLNLSNSSCIALLHYTEEALSSVPGSSNIENGYVILTYIGMNSALRNTTNSYYSALVLFYKNSELYFMHYDMRQDAADSYLLSTVPCEDYTGLGSSLSLTDNSGKDPKSENSVATANGELQAILSLLENFLTENGFTDPLMHLGFSNYTA